MAKYRDRPYGQFNYLVDITSLGEDTETWKAGFQEVSGLGMEITVTEYRSGNKRNNAPDKINTLYKVPDVTLKRGVVGSMELYYWLDKIREGSQEEQRSVTISLLSEDVNQEDPVQTWILSRAIPIKYTGPSLSGKGTDIAIEELVLACEDIKLL